MGVFEMIFFKFYTWESRTPSVSAVLVTTFMYRRLRRKRHGWKHLQVEKGYWPVKSVEVVQPSPLYPSRFSVGLISIFLVLLQQWQSTFHVYLPVCLYHSCMMTPDVIFIHFSCTSGICIGIEPSPWIQHFRGILKAPNRISTTRSCRLVKAQHLEGDMMNVRRLVVGEWSVLQMSFAGGCSHAKKTYLTTMVIQLAIFMHSVCFLQHNTYCCKWKKSCTSWIWCEYPHEFTWVFNPCLVVVFGISSISNQHVFPFCWIAKNDPFQTFGVFSLIQVRPHPSAPHRLHPMSSVSSGGLPHLGLPSSHRCCIPGTGQQWYTLGRFHMVKGKKSAIYIERKNFIWSPNLQGIIFQPLIFRGVTVDAIEMLRLHDTHPTTKKKPGL